MKKLCIVVLSLCITTTICFGVETLSFYDLRIGGEAYQTGTCTYYHTFPEPFRRFPKAQVLVYDGRIFTIRLIAKLTFTTAAEKTEYYDGVSITVPKKVKKGEFASLSAAKEFCSEETTRLVRLLEKKYKLGLKYEPGFFSKSFKQSAGGFRFEVDWGSHPDWVQRIFEVIEDIGDECNYIYLTMEISHEELEREYKEAERKKRNTAIKKAWLDFKSNMKKADEQREKEREERLHKGEDDGFELM